MIVAGIAGLRRQQRRREHADRLATRLMTCLERLEQSLSERSIALSERRLHAFVDGVGCEPVSLNDEVPAAAAAEVVGGLTAREHAYVAVGRDDTNLALVRTKPILAFLVSSYRLRHRILRRRAALD